MIFNFEISQQYADQIRWLLLILLAIFSCWGAFSTAITWRNYRQMTVGHGRTRTRWICQIFLFLTLAGLIEILLTHYRLGKSMSDYLFLLYTARTIVFVALVISATGFMLSLFGRSLWRAIRGWRQDEN